MKHITIVPALNNDDSDLMIATITGNNFGDQLIEYRVYGSTGKMKFGDKLVETSGYNTISYRLNHEGSHESVDSIVELGRILYNKGL